MRRSTACAYAPDSRSPLHPAPVPETARLHYHHLAVLALGVGATTAIFGLFDQVLLRTLPVSHPEELVRLQAHNEASAAASALAVEMMTNTPRIPPIATCAITPPPSLAA